MTDGLAEFSCRDALKPESNPTLQCDLRVLATTDLHMQMLGYDYFANRECAQGGLTRAAVRIAHHRATHPNILLLDNGDFLQGNPLGDYIAQIRGVGPRRPHPVITAMNLLNYDAATLGNHEFNFGLDFLGRSLVQARFPVISSNLRLPPGELTEGKRELVQPVAILHRRLTARNGEKCDLKIGIAGFLPPQTPQWNHALAGRVRAEDIVSAARRVVPGLRAAGADIVIALAHSGIAGADHEPDMENAAVPLAAVPGIDALVTGHIHLVFPAPDFPASRHVDPARGTLHGKPAVMSGFWGSHLGVMDLRLEQTDAGGWRVAQFTCRAEPVARIEGDARVCAPALPAHRETLRHFGRRIGHTERPLHSYFSLCGYDPGLRLTAMAQRWHVRRALRGSDHDHLPVLSAVAPFRAGGRSGAQHYTDVPAGPLTLRNLADLYLFPNLLRAIRVSGRDVTDWLERSASLFSQIAPGKADQTLIDPGFPSSNFDVIEGLTWRIDLSQPARYGANGELRNATARRISDLQYRGRQVLPDQEFLLVTNSYRLSGCGMFAALTCRCPVVPTEPVRARDVLHRYVRQRRRLAPPADSIWRFVAMPGTSALFDTGPGALAHLETMARPEIEPAGHGPDGFLRFRIHL